MLVNVHIIFEMHRKQLLVLFEWLAIKAVLSFKEQILSCSFWNKKYHGEHCISLKDMVFDELLTDDLTFRDMNSDYVYHYVLCQKCVINCRVHIY